MKTPIVSLSALAAFLMLQVPPAGAAAYSRSQCLGFVKEMKAWKAGKPLANSDNEAMVRFKLNLCLINGTLRPADVGKLLD